MADFTIKRNDTSKKIEATLKDVNKVAVDLTGATVRFHMRKKADGSAKVGAGATIVVAASGTVEYSWLAADTDATGIYEAEWQVTFSGGLIETFPNGGYIEVEVKEDVA